MQSEYIGLIVPAISFQDFQPIWSWSTNVTDRRTDRRHAIARPRFALQCNSASRGKKLLLWKAYRNSPTLFRMVVSLRNNTVNMRRFFVLPSPEWPYPYSTLILAFLGVFPLHQIAHVGVNPSISLMLFGHEIIFEEFQLMWSRYPNVPDGQTDDILWQRALCIASRGNDLKFSA